MFQKVLVPVDGSENSNRAVTVASEIAKRFDAELVLLHVMRHSGSDRVPSDLEELQRVEHIRVTEADLFRDVAESIVGKAKDIAEDSGATNVKSVIQEGDPSSCIIDFCSSHEIDLIVMGRRGLGALSGILMGSVSQKVSQLAPCACITTPHA